MKLALVTKCNIGCKYCFVNFTGEVMDLDTAKRCVDLMLESSGNEKILALYGGEPSLVFDLVSEIAGYARKRESDLNKNLTITMSTNAVAINEKIAKLFSSYRIKLFISLFGKKEYHDNERKLKDGTRGTYDLVMNSLQEIRKFYSSDDYHCSWCVTPDSVSFMEDYPKFKGMGFTYFNVEIIREHKPWMRNDIENFKLQYLAWVKLMIDEIEEGKFFFINPICWEIKHKNISKRKGSYCPFEWHFEAYPDGRVAFTPFVLNNKLNEESHIIANFKDNVAYKYKDCTFDKESVQCRSCAKDYWASTPEDLGADNVRMIHDMISIKAARIIEDKALSNYKYKQYIDIVKQKMCY